MDHPQSVSQDEAPVWKFRISGNLGQMNPWDHPVVHGDSLGLSLGLLGVHGTVHMG